jgi:hypothetical protein
MTSIRRRAGLFVLTLVVFFPEGAKAQQTGKLGIGASVGWVAAPDSSVHARPRIGPLVRFGESRDGWGVRFGFNWYAADLDETVGGDVREFGRLRVRPIMAGYGYTRVFGLVAASANVLAGYAFTSFSMRPPFENAYRDAQGVDRVTSKVANAVVLKPEVSAWIDASEKIGLNVSFGYLVARPDITVTSSAGSDRHPVRADVLMLKVGVVYSVF